MLDRAACARDVVDVHARAGHVGQVALEDDREVVADQLEERRVIDPRPGDDEAVGMLGAEQRRVGGVRAVRRERLDHHPEPAGAGRGRQTAQGLRQARHRSRPAPATGA